MVERSGTTLDRTYAALAHPIRREVLERLKAGPERVTTLAVPFDVSLAAASKHIRMLESAGLVNRSIQGRDHILSLEPNALAEARDWIDTYRWFWESRLDALEVHLEARR
jgi:DNA-binding transcriptional ArsR family regulator